MIETRSSLIWMSCFDKERTLKEISQIWNIQSTALYKFKINKSMVNEKLLKEVRTEGRNVYYKAILDGLKTKIQNIEKGKISTIDKILLEDLENHKKIKDFFESEYFRQKYFNIEAIKKLFYNNPNIAKEQGYYLPIIILHILELQYYLLHIDNINKTSQDTFNMQLDLQLSFYNLFLREKYNIKKYLEKCDIKAEDINKIPPEIAETVYYQKYVVEKMDKGFKLFKKMVIKWVQKNH